MKDPGLDGRHHDKDGGDSKKSQRHPEKNLPNPIPGFKSDTTLKTMREMTGKTSEKDIRNAVKPKK